MSDLALPPSVVERKGCFGKIRYANAAAAIRVVRRMGKSREPGRRLSHYRCKFCHQYHVGSETR